MSDVTSVRSLVTSVTALARHLDLTPNAIYRWIKVNRIPGRYLIRVAQFYDVEIPIHLGLSEQKNTNRIIEKPRETLPLCIQVQKGEADIGTVAQQLGVHPRTVQLIIKNWGDDLPVLLQTLRDLEAGEISVDSAAKTLNVSKFNVHALRRKYGFRPLPRAKPKPRPIVERRKTAKSLALDAIAGRINLSEVNGKGTLSWRTVHRTIARLSPGISMIDLTHWPKTIREAYAYEIEHEKPRIAVDLWKFVGKNAIIMKKWQKYPEKPSNWRRASAKMMMVQLLIGAETMEALAVSRGADPRMLESIFTSDLRPLGLTWNQVLGLSMWEQVAVAEVLLAVENSTKTPRVRMIERLGETR